MLDLEVIAKRAVVLGLLVLLIGLYVTPAVLKQVGVGQSGASASAAYAKYHLAVTGALASVSLSLAKHYNMPLP
jgi:xanthine/uracil permease